MGTHFNQVPFELLRFLSPDTPFFKPSASMAASAPSAIEVNVASNTASSKLFDKIPNNGIDYEDVLKNIWPLRLCNRCNLFDCLLVCWLVCWFVNSVTQKVIDRFSSNFHTLFIYA